MKIFLQRFFFQKKFVRKQRRSLKGGHFWWQWSLENRYKSVKTLLPTKWQTIKTIRIINFKELTRSVWIEDIVLLHEHGAKCWEALAAAHKLLQGVLQWIILYSCTHINNQYTTLELLQTDLEEKQRIQGRWDTSSEAKKRHPTTINWGRAKKISPTVRFFFFSI